jgi:glucokinase
MILAGDVGGTNTRLAFFSVEGRGVKLQHEERFANAGRSGLREIVEEFIAGHGLTPELACFGIAGPVRQGRVAGTNLPWIVDADELAAHLRLSRVWLVNDLEANAYGIATLAASDLVVVQRGDPQASGNAAVIAPGTGLGEAGLFWDGRQHIPFAAEGGHCDFAPADELQTDLLKHLARKHGHVSWERIVSGPGLVEIYDFLREVVGMNRTGSLPPAFEGPDRAAAISKAGLAGACPVSSRALDVFVSILGAEAGNLALKVMATGGVYVGGGIAPKIADRLKAPDFLAAFRAKGRMARLMEDIPVSLILDDKAALKGAAWCAALRAGKVS